MQAHKLVKDHFHNKFLFPDNFCRIGKELNYNPMRKQNKVNMLKQSLDDPLLEVKVKGYIPGAVLRNLRPDSPEDEHWSNEVRCETKNAVDYWYMCASHRIRLLLVHSQMIVHALLAESVVVG